MEMVYRDKEETTYRDQVLRDLTDIKDLARKTNGRVTKLENWRWFLAGMGTLIVIVLIPVLAIVFQLIHK